MSAIVFLGANGCVTQTSSGSRLQNPGTQANWFVVRNGEKRINWEADKQQRGIPTDTIVIHEYDDANTDRVTLASNSALERERIYAKTWPALKKDPDGAYLMPVQSGHFRTIDGKEVEVFYTYHKLVFPDGMVIDALNDSDDPAKFEVGWHAKHWPTNCRSVAICMVGDFATGPGPDAKAKSAAAKLIRAYVDRFRKNGIRDADIRVIGHRQAAALSGAVRGCPGEWFFAGGQQELMKLAGLPEFLKAGAPNLEPHPDPLPPLKQ